MSLALDDLSRDPEWLLQQLRHMAEVVAAERSRIGALEIERDTVLAERDAAQAEIEKLRLLIRQLQRGQFGRRSEMNGAAVHRPRSAAARPGGPRADRGGRRGGAGGGGGKEQH